MGIALILLGLVAAGTVADFLLENEMGESAQAFDLFGGTFTMSQTEVVLGAAVLGALAVLFLGLGMGLARGSWGRRRADRHRRSDLERMNADLERENAQLRTKTTTSGPWARTRDEVPGGRPEEVHTVRVPDAPADSEEVHVHRRA